MRDLISSGELGAIYSCRMFYGNGTARLVRDSEWRDQGGGVIPDLGSHLLDTCRFWFGDVGNDARLISASRFENRAPDHAIFIADGRRPRIELEMTLCMWRNHFTCDILAEHGTAHIESLCKWGPTTFRHRRRVLPSGSPPETAVTLTQEDPTWALEYEHFKKLCGDRTATDLSNDLTIQRTLRRLAKDADSMNRPTVGFAGMTHLGLVSATAIAAKGFPTICYDPDRTLIAALERGVLPVVEPGLAELLSANGSNQRFSHQRGALSACDIVYIATDVPTDDQGQQRPYRHSPTGR